MRVPLSGTLLPLPTPVATRQFNNLRLSNAQPDPGMVAGNHPSNLYATISKNGEVFAQVYNSGLLYQPNKFAIGEAVTNEGHHGQPLADARIAQLLRLSAGEITYNKPATAPTQRPQAAANAFYAQLLASRW